MFMGRLAPSRAEGVGCVAGSSVLLSDLCRETRVLWASSLGLLGVGRGGVLGVGGATPLPSLTANHFPVPAHTRAFGSGEGMFAEKSCTSPWE